jgi:2-keto-4-pentenoate hydratase/2-oxohepta-3-ene-1,7-dioic acid hydratase in catechol pathway
MPEEYVRFVHQGRPVWGRRLDGQLEVLAAAPWAGLQATGERVALEGIERLAPAEPSKILCVGLNYKDHAAEMGHPLPEEPVLFMKPATALLDPGKAIRLPRSSQRVDYEAELAFVIGKKTGPGLSVDGALFGFSCANDVTARDLQKKDGQWTRAKGFDTFCPLGPSLWTGVDAADLAISCHVNGQTKQQSRTSQLIFSTQRILAFVAVIMTLLPGDVVLTGTPSGIGPLAAGEQVEVRIEGLGSLINPVSA